MAMHEAFGVSPFSESEQALIARIDATWTRDKALVELADNLQIALEVELATLPIYLFTYYSIARTVAKTEPAAGFPSLPISRFADQAGGLVMSVAVEEMLHMSLAANLLHALGHDPQIYGKSPGPYPTNLPGHTKLGPDHQPLLIPLASFSREQLWRFLEIEYPATVDAPPEGSHWQTIGQIYSYIRSIIGSKWIADTDFQRGQAATQIQPSNYSPNNIDTVYPDAPFDFAEPVAPPLPGSTASVTRFASRGDSHVGSHQLLVVGDRRQALQAIATISFQGEGFSHTRIDDSSRQELSHYYKFLTLQSQLAGYRVPDADHPLPALPRPPSPAKQQWTAAELAQVVFEFPKNPVADDYPPGCREFAQIVGGLYQYMLIMTEAIFRQPPDQQKRYFNQSLHRSMIWILDKILRGMRQIPLDDAARNDPKFNPDRYTNPGGLRLAPTFENVDLGPRYLAFENLKQMVATFERSYGEAPWYAHTVRDYVQMIPTLPDVSDCWVSRYRGAAKFPGQPPAKVGKGEARHACMGLNACKGQGRTRDNACAGQGYCSTALRYNYAEPSKPLVADHTCHVLNACNGQGGCGLYGTGEEQDSPGANACATLGSCATPINAERFSTDGSNRGKSVWLRARAVFATKTWPSLRDKNPKLPESPPPVPGTKADPNLFAFGPTIEWIQDYSGQGMTACGASGLSGAGSCG